MKKLFALSLGLILVVAFQNCGQPRFASAEMPNQIYTLPGECNDTTSCFLPPSVLGRYPTRQVTEITYTRSGGFPGPAEPASSVYYGVRIAIDHAAKKLNVLPLIAASTASLTISTTPPPTPSCEVVYGGTAYEELVQHLQAARLEPVDSETPVLIDGGTANLNLIVGGNAHDHLFQNSDSVRSGEVIVNSQALEAKLIQFKNVGCPVFN